MPLRRNSAPIDRPAVDLEETRRRFLVAREQIAAHGSADWMSSVREIGRWPSAPQASRHASV
jgi:hypothetical protein